MSCLAFPDPSSVAAPSARGGGGRRGRQQQESSDDEDRLEIDEEDLIEDEEDRKRWVLGSGVLWHWGAAWHSMWSATCPTAQPCWLATATRAATVFSVWCRFMYTLEPTPSVLQAGSHD